MNDPHPSPLPATGNTTDERGLTDRPRLSFRLSLHSVQRIVWELTPFFGSSSPVSIVFRGAQGNDQIVHGTFATLPEHIKGLPITGLSPALIIV
jgi:precorrin-4/cobalt-precorrin-4 C11-methyltransferase